MCDRAKFLSKKICRCNYCKKVQYKFDNEYVETQPKSNMYGEKFNIYYNINYFDNYYSGCKCCECEKCSCNDNKEKPEFNCYECEKVCKCESCLRSYKKIMD